jgi:hypothetical protein
VDIKVELRRESIDIENRSVWCNKFGVGVNVVYVYILIITKRVSF